MPELAIRGGEPVTGRAWPSWPATDTGTEALVLDALRSGRWALSGPSVGRRGYEQRFADEFADFLRVRHCVPTTNGTASLVVALEALDVGVGDEVLVPAVSWVASLSTVLAVNARPVIVDVDPRTMCMDPAAAEAAIGPRTRAISLVHLYSSVCDLDAYVDLCRRYGLALIEDCAQAHGAQWRGRRVGSIGDVGCFSMQQTKLLTAGEGGAAVTGDPALYRRMYQLRADGRSSAAPAPAGEMELAAEGEVMGANYCMPELVAAALIGQLRNLEALNAVRAGGAQILDKYLSQVPGVRPVPAHDAVTSRTYYFYVFQIDREAFAGADASTVAAAVQAETGAQVQPAYPPLYRHPLVRPDSKRRFRAVDAAADQLARVRCPQAERAFEETVTVAHPVLLSTVDGLSALADAVAKVQRYAHELAGLTVESVRPL
jgi:dTDP-4-amino-4,6-dideoxygalactose transaminase